MTALISAIIDEREFPLEIDYSVPIERRIDGLHFSITGLIFSEKLPTYEGEGKDRLVSRLVRFNYRITEAEARTKIDELGFRPATISELVAFGISHKGITHRMDVHALGSSLKEVARLGSSSLSFGVGHAEPYVHCWFLVVPK